MTDRTVIIGAGMAGLACARALSDAGQTTVILDKGRGIGGRVATRRVTVDNLDLSFDHGAGFVMATDPAFDAMLASLAGVTAIWADGAAQRRHVGVPGMSSLPKAMAGGLDVRSGVEVTALKPARGGWRIESAAAKLGASRVVVTVPAPQVAPLIGAQHPLVAPLGAVAMAPCLTLMAAFPTDAPRPFVSRAPEAGPLEWIARDSSKPGRPAAATTWVAHAGPGWSAAHLETDRDVIARAMLPHLCDAIGSAPERAIHSAAHRWRYARVTAPPGRPFLRNPGADLYLGGDWCLGPDVVSAWQSGRAIAQDILGSAHAR